MPVPFPLPGGATPVPGGALVTWANPQDVANRAMKVMRLGGGDVDASRVVAAAGTALMLIDNYLDRADDPVVQPAPEPLLHAADHVTIRLYRDKDIPFGVLDSWSESGLGPIRVAGDWIKGVEDTLLVYAHHYGVG